MDIAAAILLLLVSIPIAIYASRRRANKHLPQIYNYIENERGCKVIEIIHNWDIGDSDTQSFDIIYADPSGDQHQASCKVRTGWLSDGVLYWSNTVPNYRTNSLGLQSRKNTTIVESPQLMPEATVLLHKDTLIQDLQTENAELRATIEQLREQLKQQA